MDQEATLPINVTEYIANPMRSRPCSQTRPCTAVCERRATTSLTPLTNHAERATFLQGGLTSVTVDALLLICEIFRCSRRLWHKRLSTSEFPTGGAGSRSSRRRAPLNPKVAPNACMCIRYRFAQYTRQRRDGLGPNFARIGVSF